jgi:hypothetical protein
MGGRKVLAAVAAVVSTLALLVTAGPVAATVVTATARVDGVAPAPGGAATAPAKVTPAISVSPSVVYPPNALCTAIGIPTANTATVNGTGFAHAKTAKVLVSGRKVATGLTDSTGAFQTSFTDRSQPDGTYPVVAKTGRRQASSSMYSSGSACASASGPEARLKWKMQGVGFDANTEADLLIGGSVYHATTTSAKGAFLQRFTQACPGHGTFSLQFRGSFGGKVVDFGSGSLHCP